jgi:IclR family transcriptional regulator, acetate operon repressor
MQVWNRVDRAFRISNAVRILAQSAAGAMKDPTETHRATGRVLELFEYLAASGETTTLAALSARMDIPKSSLLPLLRTLVARKWLEQPLPATYRVASTPPFGGSWSHRRKELSELARPFLAQLAMQTGESCILGVLPPSGDSVVYIDKVDSAHTVRYVAELGATRPLHCTSSGLAVLAFMPRDKRDALLKRLELEKFTPMTVTHRAELARRLKQIASEGVAVSVQEFNLGAIAIAAPIRSADGEVRAACALAGPVERMKAHLERHKESVKATALAISATLGWKPEVPARLAA